VNRLTNYLNICITNVQNSLLKKEKTKVGRFVKLLKVINDLLSTMIKKASCKFSRILMKDFRIIVTSDHSFYD
jgi:hypothetical protein